MSASHAEVNEYVLIFDRQIKLEMIPELISLPEIKAEPDVVSYVSVCHRYTIMARIWVYWDQLDANCLVLFYYTFFTLHDSDVIYIHPQERHIMHMQSDTGK